MDPTQMGAFPCGDWDPLSLLFTHEDLDLTHGANQMYDEMSFEIPADYISASFGGYTADQTMPGICGSFLNPTQSPNCSSLGGSSQEGSFGSGLSNSFSEYYAELPMLMEERYSGNSFVPDFMGILAGEGFSQSDDDNNNNNNPGSDVPADREASVPAAKRLQLKRKCTKSKSSTGEEDNAGTDVIRNLKKRKPRASEDKGKKNVQPKMKKKLAVAGDDGEDGITIARQEGQSLSTCSSEEVSVSEEIRNGESAQNSNETSTLNSDGKTARASRGTATDPQSLYARRRRERINERLRILQNLVPNGTKVDISTMLEEAVHYVKFLQLQIKLLSSDELWMYAPIAYNGMDIGLNSQIIPPQLL